MEVTTVKCDICGKLAHSDDYNSPKGWYIIRKDGDRDKDFWARNRDICDECALKLNLHILCENAEDMRLKNDKRPTK